MKTAQSLPTVFVSYNHKDQLAARYLAAALSAEGLSLFFDDRGLKAGDSLPQSISQAIDNSSTFGLFVGAAGVGDFQKLEINAAVHRLATDAEYRIVIALMPGGNVQMLPALIRPYLVVDFQDLEDSPAIRKLLDGIHRRASFAQPLDSQGLQALPPYRTMALPVKGFVARRELAQLLAAILNVGGVPHETEKASTILLATAIRGAGGFGKTALAQALCLQEEVREHFPAGTLWVTLGQNLNESQRLSKIKDLLRWWTRKDPPPFETIEAAAAALREAMLGQRALLVIDDVWTTADLAPFAEITAPTALLIATRNARVVPEATQAIMVDALDLAAATELLGQGLNPLPEKNSLEQLATRLGEWPILLKLVNAQLREEYRAGTPSTKAMQIVEASLDELGLTAFDREDEEARNLAIRRTIEASLQRLSASDRSRYAQLAIFQEDEHVYLEVLGLLWAAEANEVWRVSRRLEEMSLLYYFDTAGQWIQLHDVMRAYLMGEHRQHLVAFHTEFLDRFGLAKKVPLALQVRAYFIKFHAYHLKNALREEDLEKLLFSYAWLQEKIAETDVNSAMADYSLLENQEDAAVIRRTLLLSRTPVQNGVAQLRSHLHGRLGDTESTNIGNLLAQANVESGMWLRPVTASFRKPTGALELSIVAHAGEVRAILQLDREKIITAASDGEIRIWRLRTGELIHTYPASGSAINHLIKVSEQEFIIGSETGRIESWKIGEDSTSRAFEGHRASITAMKLRGSILISGDAEGNILVSDIDSQDAPVLLPGHPKKITGLGFLDNRTIISTSEDRTLRVWNLPSKRQTRQVTLPVFPAQCLLVRSSQEVIIGTAGGQIQVWRPLKDNKPRRSFRQESAFVTAMAMIGPDLGVSTREIHGIQLWDPNRGVLGSSYHVAGRDIRSLERFEDEYLLCGTQGGLISAFSIEMLKREDGTADAPAIYALAAVDGARVASGSSRGKIKIFNAVDGSLEDELGQDWEGYSDLIVSESGFIIASELSGKRIQVWNLANRQIVRSITSPEKCGAIAAFDRFTLVSVPGDVRDRNKPMHLWGIVDKRLDFEMVEVEFFVSKMLAIDGRFLVLATYDGIILHFDISTYKDRRNFALKGHERGVNALIRLSDGRLASGSMDKTIRIWDLDRQETIHVLAGHGGPITGLAEISAGLLVSGSADRTVRVWNLNSLKTVASLELDTGVASLVALPAIRTIVVGDNSGNLHFLKLENQPE